MVGLVGGPVPALGWGTVWWPSAGPPGRRGRDMRDAALGPPGAHPRPKDAEQATTWAAGLRGLCWRCLVPRVTDGSRVSPGCTETNTQGRKGLQSGRRRNHRTWPLTSTVSICPFSAESQRGFLSSSDRFTVFQQLNMALFLRGGPFPWIRSGHEPCTEPWGKDPRCPAGSARDGKAACLGAGRTHVHPSLRTGCCSEGSARRQGRGAPGGAGQRA